MPLDMGKGRGLSNTEKAAVTLLSLGKELASNVLRNLTEAEVKRVTRAFMAVSEVGREVQFEVTKEFRQMLKAGEVVLVDGREFARDIIEGAFGAEKGEGLLDYISGSRKESMIQIMRDIPEKILQAFILSEHPQTVSFLLTKMHPEQSSKILQSMTEETQTDIVIRIAHLNNVKSDVVDEVREVLRSQMSRANSEEEEVSGPKAAADILNMVERANEERILTEVEEMYPDLADQIRNLMFTFEDIQRLDDRAVQTVLKDVPRDQLVLALKQASDGLSGLIFRNVSSRAADMMREDLEVMGPVKRKDVDKAQQGIIDVVRRLEAEGKIQIGTGGEDDSFV